MVELDHNSQVLGNNLLLTITQLLNNMKKRMRIQNYNLQLMRAKQLLYNRASRLETHRQTLLRVIKVKHEHLYLLLMIEPVLFVDVNLGSGVSKRITVF